MHQRLSMHLTTGKQFLAALELICRRLSGTSETVRLSFWLAKNVLVPKDPQQIHFGRKSAC
jgi:hypothetical protein